MEGPGRRPADPRPHRQLGDAVEDIIVDCLTFPIATGQEETRRDGLETIEAIREVKRRFPDVQTTLGVSNVSFGLNPAARMVLNSVFLHECVKAGLDSAIVHAAKILPMARIPDEQREVALDLVYDRRRPHRHEPAYDPLHGSSTCSRASTPRAAGARAPTSWPPCRWPSGSSGASSTASANGLEADLDEAMRTRPALEIINDSLLDGMKSSASCSAPARCSCRSCCSRPR